jgi:hypothetical protein
MCSSLVHSFLDLLPSMRYFCDPDHLRCHIVDDCDSRGFTARIKLHPQRLWLSFGPGVLLDDRKRIATQHGSMSGCEQMPGATRMDRIEWFALLIDNKHG